MSKRDLSVGIKLYRLRLKLGLEFCEPGRFTQSVRYLLCRLYWAQDGLQVLLSRVYVSKSRPVPLGGLPCLCLMSVSWMSMALISHRVATLSGPLSSGSTVASSSWLSRSRSLESDRITLVEFHIASLISDRWSGAGIRTHALPGWKPGAFPLGDARLKIGPGSGI